MVSFDLWSVWCDHFTIVVYGTIYAGLPLHLMNLHLHMSVVSSWLIDLPTENLICTRPSCEFYIQKSTFHIFMYIHYIRVINTHPGVFGYVSRDIIDWVADWGHIEDHVISPQAPGQHQINLEIYHASYQTPSFTWAHIASYHCTPLGSSY